ncbi:MAG: HEAT repeat domain-containing protein [Actinobacteria bacterium]|jgi:HEAT repeat protein|nr:MAG: HEAT repeat domain-containing protein [Actinomycetota bacterium]
MEDGQAQSVEQKESAALSEEEEMQLKSVVDIFSRLSIACKSRSLYPAEHPTAIDAVVLLHAVMENSLHAISSITVKVGKDRLVCDKWVVGQRMESLRVLASRIRALNIQEIFIDAGVSFQEAEALVELLISDPEELEKAGGPETFLLAKGVHSIVVVESSAQRADDDEEEDTGRIGEDLAAPPEEIEREEAISPEQISDLLELLLNPEELGRLLMALTGEGGRPLDRKELAAAAFVFLRDAAAIVEREHPERKQECCRAMAESLLFLNADVRNLLLLGQMLPQLRDEPVCSEILNQFSAQEMADLLSIFLPLVPELTPKVGSLLKVMGFREGEIRHALRLLRAKLVDLGQIPPHLLAPLGTGTERGKSEDQPAGTLPTFEEIAGILGEYREEEMAEIRLISDYDPAVDMLADTTPMLLDLLRQGGSLDNPGKVVELMVQNFWGLTTSAQLGLAASVLEGTREILRIADPAIDPFRSSLTRMLEEAASERVMQRTIKLACDRRGDPQAVEELKSYMAELGERGIAAMVEALGAEEDMSVRKYIIDVLTALCRDRIPLLGAYVDDPRWYLVRNILSIMARFHDPETVPYLRRTFNHPNPKVKSETIRALGMTGGYGACELLMQGLEDQDERTRILCVRWLGRLEEARAVNRLVKMLEDREPGAESLNVKKEIIISLGQIRAPECCEVLRKYQSKQKRLNRAEWQELNLAASQALQRLTQKFPHLERKR